MAEEVFFDGVLEAEADDEDGDAGYEDAADVPEGGVAAEGEEADNHGPEFVPEDHDGAEDGCGVEDDVELEAFGAVEAEAENLSEDFEVARGADGQVFGKALDDAENEGCDNVHCGK